MENKGSRGAKHRPAKGIWSKIIGLFYGDYPGFLPKQQPGKMEDLSKESYEYAQMQGSLFNGIQFNHDMNTENLKFMTNIRAGTPGKDASFSTSAICFSNFYFVQAQWDGVSTAVARTRIRLHPSLDVSATARVGSDYNKNFIAELGADFAGANYTVELQYEGAQENIVTASYTQTLVKGLFASSAFIYSLTQKSCILSLAGRGEYRNLALTGTVVLPQIPNMNLLLPNRITAGFSATNESEKFYKKFSTEFQLNPSEENAFDSITIGMYELRRRGSTLKLAIDTMMRFSVLYEEMEPGASLGLISFSALADYQKNDYKFGLGYSLQQ